MIEVEGFAICPIDEPYDGSLPVIRFHPTNGEVFGAGWHPSTQAALKALREAVKPGCSVLDFGTGTGILSIAAKRWGAGDITAIEKDPVALEYARAAFALNGVAVELLTQLPDDGIYDVVVANIGEVGDLSHTLRYRVKARGVGLWGF